jgi:NAD(P)H-hydrate epimerase
LYNLKKITPVNTTSKDDTYLLDHAIAKIVKTGEKHPHKETYGYSLIIAGSYGKIRAAVLASQACLRVAADLLTTYIPKCGYKIVQTLKQKKVTLPINV